MAQPDTKQITVEFDDNELLPILYGEHNKNLSNIAKQLDVVLMARGRAITISGLPQKADAARDLLNALWEKLKTHRYLDEEDIDTAVRMITGSGSLQERTKSLAGMSTSDLTISTRKRPVYPRSPNQSAYIQALRDHEMVFGLGPAGTGKTYLAVAQAVSMLINGHVDRIILSRPAVEAGEKLGFLPGTLKEKVDPYLRPLYDALHDMMPAEQVQKGLEVGDIEVAPLAFMRGRTLSHSFVILDEAQNTTPMQIKMFMTRLGEHSRMVVTGDLTQIDLPSGVKSGLVEAVNILKDVPEIAVIRFTDADVVRHPLVTKIVRAYDKAETKK